MVHCIRLNASPQIHMLNPNAQCDDNMEVRHLGGDEVVRVEALCMGLVPF